MFRKKSFQPLKGKKIIVTAGGTQENIDPVRYIGNYSSGKQGFAIADKLYHAGAEVTLIYGKTDLPPPPYIKSINTLTADLMWHELETVLPSDVLICTAAVADWKIAKPNMQKLKKSDKDSMQLELITNIDILKTICEHKKRPELVIGFAAETENCIANAQQKRKRKKCDWILVNDVSNNKVFGKDMTDISLITNDKIQNWNQITKNDVAAKLTTEIIGYFKYDKNRN